MSLEGLQAVLDKEEIVSTPLAGDMLDHPARIEELFRRHVRTYIPLGRQATGGEQGPSVAEFERQIVRDVREGGATRGYLTGEYGYGKTSTALYLWERARAENLLAVPPFKFQNLKDLVIASYGWARYELGRTRPDLLSKVQGIYDTAVDRSAQAFARRYSMSLGDAQQMLQEQPELLRLNTQDYIRFIEALTSLTQEAGFAGLLILADELQQYIEPTTQAGQRDPISALFDLVEAIRSRRGQLPFGLVLIIPPKDLGLLRDQRGDLVHRMLQASLDLSTIYDRRFPQRLWHRLATTFAFEDHRDRIISAECLDALGQIAARGDLSDGPRTVINAIRRATQRYIAAGHPENSPYTPERLIEDFLNGAITFDSARRIPHITGQALGHSMVKGHPLRERAIKWAAAFPQEGLPRALQEHLSLAEVFDELARSVLNDLLIEVGDRCSGGLTLRGLDQVGVQTDWLTTAIREFWRAFDQDQEQSRRWVIAAFLSLLTAKVFPANQWSVSNYSAGGLFASAGMTLEGCFATVRQRFPDRRIVVQVIWQDEPDLGKGDDAELVVLFRIHSEVEEMQDQGRSALRTDVSTRRIEVDLDLLRRDDSLVSTQIDQFVRPAILSTHLTPRLLLALYQFLDEKRANNLIPKEDQQFVQYAFQAALLDAAFQLLFHSGLDDSRGVGQERLIESALTTLLEQLYPAYTTLIRTSQWSSAIQKYSNVLQRHDLVYERQGKLPIEGTKREIAAIFGLSDTGFDNFIENFGALIVIERPFPTRATARAGEKGAVRLTLHPLEQAMMSWLQAAPHETLPAAKVTSAPLRGLPLAEIRRRAAQLGYLPQEIDTGVRLLGERQLVEHEPRRDTLYEKAVVAPSLDEIDRALTAWRNDLEVLRRAFPASAQIAQWQQVADACRHALDEQLQDRPDDKRALEIKGQILGSRRLLEAFAEEQQQQLREKASRNQLSLPRFDRRLVARLDTVARGAVTFAQTLNALRVEALNRYEGLDDALNRARSELDEVQRTIQNEGLSLSMLAKSAMDLAQCEQAIDTVRLRYDQFMGQAEVFEGWLNLTEQASQLGEELQQLGGEAGTYRTTFDRWMRDVRAALTNQTYDTIEASTAFHQELDTLSDTVQQAVTAAAQRFAEKQTRYRQVIEDRLGLNHTTLWPLHQYNPQAVAEGESQLLADVKATIQRWCGEIGRIIRQAQTDTRSTLDSPQVAALSRDERQQLQEQGIRLETELKVLSRELMDYEGRTEDHMTLRDLPIEGGGRFRGLIQDLGRLKVQTERIQPEVRSLQQTLQSLQLTPAEELLFAALSSSDVSIEIANLRSMTTALTDVDFWKALQGLHAKRRLRVHCERMVSE
jgi:hypothetical protein